MHPLWHYCPKETFYVLRDRGDYRLCKKVEEMMSSDWKIIIVDNAFPNGSGKELEVYYKEKTNISVLLSERNLRFARGNNPGYQEAKKYRPDFIGVMNNDILLTQKNFVERVYALYKNNAFDVLEPDIFFDSDKYTSESTA